MQSYFGFVVFVLVIGFIIYLAIASDSFLDFSSFKIILPKFLSIPSPVVTTTSNVIDDLNKNNKKEFLETEAGESKKSEDAGEKLQTQQNENQPEIIPPKGFTKEQLSPYYQKIKISSLSRNRWDFYFSRNFTSLTLSTYYSSKDEKPINISGWYIMSNRGIVLNIPQAVSDYNPKLAVNEDIVLEPGGSVTFYNTESPIRFNLRLNKCLGYLNNNYNFVPNLPRNCPYVDRSEIITFSGDCQSFIMSRPRCYQPTPNEINSFSLELACRQVLDSLNYGGCYSRYRNDKDFFSKEWWVWLGNGFNTSSLDEKHDRLLLFDKQNLLVDEYIY